MHEVLRVQGVREADYYLLRGADLAARLLPHARLVEKHDGFNYAKERAMAMARNAREDEAFAVRDERHPNKLLLVLSAATERRRAAALEGK